MQVLPDDRDSYHSIHGEGSFTMTGLEYVIDVAQAGRHTLYLRWSGGDDRGAGDSLYVVMREYGRQCVHPQRRLGPREQHDRCDDGSGAWRPR